MKVKLGILIFLVSIPLTAQIQLGIRPAITFSQVNFNPGVSQEMKLGYAGGLIFKHVPGKNVGLQIEVNYIQKGWNQTIANNTLSAATDLDYIQVPLITHAFIGKRNVKFFLNLGPYVSYLVRVTDGTANLDLGEIDTEVPQFQIDADNYWDAGILAGIGVAKIFGFGVLQAEFRFETGFTNVIRPPEFGAQNVSKNVNMSFSIAYLFHLTKKQ